MNIDPDRLIDSGLNDTSYYYRLKKQMVWWKIELSVSNPSNDPTPLKSKSPSGSTHPRGYTPISQDGSIAPVYILLWTDDSLIRQ